MDVEVDKSWLRSGAGEAGRCGCGCDIRQVSEYLYGLGSVRGNLEWGVRWFYRTGGGHGECMCMCMVGNGDGVKGRGIEFLRFELKCWGALPTWVVLIVQMGLNYGTTMRF